DLEHLVRVDLIHARHRVSLHRGRRDRGLTEVLRHEPEVGLAGLLPRWGELGPVSVRTLHERSVRVGDRAPVRRECRRRTRLALRPLVLRDDAMRDHRAHLLRRELHGLTALGWPAPYFARDLTRPLRRLLAMVRGVNLP